MGTSCKGMCKTLKIIAKKPIGGRRYATGQKRCNICHVFVWWEGKWCPCCGIQLRTKPRAQRYKAALAVSR